MSPAFRRYLDQLNELRCLRESHEDTPELLDIAEQPILDEMERIGAELSEAERVELRSESWRAWPHDFALRMVALRDVAVWKRKGAPARETKAA